MATTTAALSDPVRAFLDEVMPVTIGTSRSDGSVQLNPAWYDRRDDEIWLNPATSRAWGKRLEAGERVTLLFVDPKNMWRWAQVQGESLERTTDGAEQHIDELALRYLGASQYPNHDTEDPRQIVRVRPVRVTGTFDE